MRANYMATIIAQAVEVEGPLDGNHYVFDFIALKNLARQITEELDHRLMLPTRNAHIKVRVDEHGVEVRYLDREWRFPRGDCVLLPIENTTSELLARYIGQRLLADLQRNHGFSPRILRVEVEESPASPPPTNGAQPFSLAASICERGPGCHRRSDPTRARRCSRLNGRRSPPWTRPS